MFEFEHARLGDRAARCGKTTDLAARRQHTVAGDDQRHRVSGHGLADITRGFRPRAKFLRQGAIGGGMTPAEPPGSSIDLLEERVLLPEIEFETGEIDRLTGKIALCRIDRFHDRRGGLARFGSRQPAKQRPLGGLGAFRRQLETGDTDRVLCDAAEAACGLKDEIMVHCLAHIVALAFRSVMRIVQLRAKNNPIHALCAG